jgi:hypothetical protein
MLLLLSPLLIVLQATLVQQGRASAPARAYYFLTHSIVSQQSRIKMNVLAKPPPCLAVVLLLCSTVAVLCEVGYLLVVSPNTHNRRQSNLLCLMH